MLFLIFFYFCKLTFIHRGLYNQSHKNDSFFTFHIFYFFFKNIGKYWIPCRLSKFWTNFIAEKRFLNLWDWFSFSKQICKLIIFCVSMIESNRVSVCDHRYMESFFFHVLLEIKMSDFLKWNNEGKFNNIFHLEMFLYIYIFFKVRFSYYHIIGTVYFFYYLYLYLFHQI